MITIQKTTKEDAATLADIQKKAFIPLYEIYHDDKNPALRGPEDILCRLDNEKYVCRSIMLDGESVGCLFFRKKGGGEYYLQRIFIDPRVQSRGIATEAILLCEAEMPDAVKFTVDFPEDRPMNKRCYEKAGYRDTGRCEKISDRLTLAIYEKIVGHK